MTENSTFTSERVADADRLAERRAVTYLFVLLDCERLQHVSSRYALDDVSIVHIGRGSEQTASTSANRNELSLTLPDRRASRAHARLWRHEGRWWIEDLGSKNGTWVDEVRIEVPSALREGSILEIGHTFFMLRAAAAPQVPDVTALRPDGPGHGIATLVPELMQGFAELAAFARTSGQVALLGETGSGKDVIANAYHLLTGRTGAFVPVNCGALPASLVEATLFGHRKGAFSGAATENAGLVRAADGGTLFLDEIGDLPLPAQAALLRVIEAREVTPVGASLAVRVDVRIVCATHRDIPSMVASGTFREDLWARLAGLVVHVPPLRERLEDLGLFVSAAISRYAKDRRDRLRISPSVGRELLTRSWPLNIRELMNTIAHAVAIAATDLIEMEHLPAAHVAATTRPIDQRSTEPPRATGSGDTPSAHDELDQRSRILRARLELLLSEHGGNVSEVARVLGKPRPTIHRWINELDIDTGKFRRRNLRGD